MIKRKLSEADWFLILANLLPVYGVFFLGWNAREVFLVYCLESLIIGALTLLKLIAVTLIRKRDWWYNNGGKSMQPGALFIVFFLAHYGLFMFIQISMFMGFSSLTASTSFSITDAFITPFKVLDQDAWIMLGVFTASYAYENLTAFIMQDEYKTHSFTRIMFEPYPRVFIQQITVIFGGMLLMFGASGVFVLIFAVAKIFFTVYIDYKGIMSRIAGKASAVNEEGGKNSLGKQ